MEMAIAEADSYRGPKHREYWQDAVNNRHIIVDGVEEVCKAIRTEIFP